MTRLLLGILGFARTVSLLGALPRFRVGGPSDMALATSWAGTINHMSGGPYGGTCLDRSVFLWFIMRQHGLIGVVRIGISYDRQVLEGHAWVEHRGVVINDSFDVAQGYSVFEEDPIGIVFR